MFKKIFTALAALTVALSLFAQSYTGGVKGTLKNRAAKSPIENARLTLYSGAQLISETVSDKDGNFVISNLDDGIYSLVINEIGRASCRERV